MAGFTLITGATGGLGQAFARASLEGGRDVILSGRDRHALGELQLDLSAAFPGRRVEFLTADLGDANAATTLWDAAEALGPIDILVNNAGLGAHGPFAGANDAREDLSIAVNVLAATALMRCAIRAMTAKGFGRILNVASAAGYMGGPNMAVYHATKAYLLTLADGVRPELAGTGVTVTTLCPGATQTGFFDDAEVEQTYLMWLLPMGNAAEVARVGWQGAIKGRATVITGWVNHLAVLSARLLPRPWVAWLLGKFLAKRK